MASRRRRAKDAVVARAVSLALVCALDASTALRRRVEAARLSHGVLVVEAQAIEQLLVVILDAQGPVEVLRHGITQYVPSNGVMYAILDYHQLLFLVCYERVPYVETCAAHRLVGLRCLSGLPVELAEGSVREARQLLTAAPCGFVVCGGTAHLQLVRELGRFRFVRQLHLIVAAEAVFFVDVAVRLGRRVRIKALIRLHLLAQVSRRELFGVCADALAHRGYLWRVLLIFVAATLTRQLRLATEQERLVLVRITAAFAGGTQALVVPGHVLLAGRVRAGVLEEVVASHHPLQLETIGIVDHIDLKLAVRVKANQLVEERSVLAHLLFLQRVQIDYTADCEIVFLRSAARALLAEQLPHVVALFAQEAKYGENVSATSRLPM